MTEIENIIDTSEFDDVLLGGDFNYDKRRNSGFVKAMNEFLHKLGLVSVWEKFAIDYTHLHTDLGSSSILDNFFVNKELLEYVKDGGPIHLGDNLSRHSPIMIKIDVGNIPAKARTTSSTARPRKPAWAKATTDDKLEYTVLLGESLEQLTLPGSLLCADVHCKSDLHNKERDSFVLDIMSSVIECSHACIPLSKRVPTTGGDPSKKCPIQKALPGWKEDIAPLRKDSLFWHSVWVSADRPKGALQSVMAWSRRKYHLAIRKAKRLANSIRAAELQEAAAKGDIQLMEEMKKTLGKKSVGNAMPESLEGEVSEEGILGKFKELYEALYNSCGTENAMAIIKDKLAAMISTDSLAEVEKVTGEVVKKACLRMKPGKTDVSEAYSSDVFLNSPDILFDLLANVFKSYLVHGSVTLQILVCAFMPLFKGGLKNPDQFKSYRAIAGASQILKLFEYVVLEVWGSTLCSDSMQFGYKAGTSTTQCSWLVNEVSNYFLRRGTAVTACLLDASMAFDKCRFDLLFQKLIDKGLPAIVVRTLVYVYEEQTGHVKLAGRRSGTFKITNGTRQGSVLSPALWCVYLDNLIQKLRNLKLGAHVAGVWMGATGYADDLLLLAPVRSVLAEMVRVCEDYGKQHNMVFSTDPVPAKSKTKCMFFCGHLTGVKYPDHVKLDGKTLPWVVTAEHLGHTLHHNKHYFLLELFSCNRSSIQRNVSQFVSQGLVPPSICWCTTRLYESYSSVI